MVRVQLCTWYILHLLVPTTGHFVWGIGQVYLKWIPELLMPMFAVHDETLHSPCPGVQSVHDHSGN